MRHLHWMLAIALLVPGVLFSAVPATQPAGTILVFPFVSPAERNFDWIGKGVQQNLIAELSPNLRGEGISPANLPATDDASTALKAARDHHAAALVFGGTQLLDKQIRITGQVLDVDSGKLLGTLKATGGLDDLFHLEDTLAGQVLRALPRPMLNLRGLAAASRGNLPQIIQLPSDSPAPMPSYQGSYSYSPLYAPQPYATLEPPAPPYSPYGYSYPYRFYYPYYHLFSYDGDFFAPRFFPFGFGFEGRSHGTTHHVGRR